MRRWAITLAVAAVLPWTAGAQALPAQNANSAAGDKSHLYIEMGADRLRKAVPALEELKAAESQEELPALLSQMAGAIAQAVPRLPDLISREDVFRELRKVGPDAPRNIVSLSYRGNGPMNQTTITQQRARGEEYRYLILCHRTGNGATSLEELRTDLKGKAPDGAKAGQLASGFAYQWLLFGAANQEEFHFRYLGEEHFEGRETRVVAFAQIPGHVRYPAVFRSEGKQAAYLYQGILWLDRESGNIVFLRSDIEEPLKVPHLDQLTTELRFRRFAIKDYDESFWLPSEVHLGIDQGQLVIDEQHSYTDYHLYHATARLVP